MTPKASARRWSAVAVLGAMALAVLDAGIVNAALPALGHALGTAPADTILVISAYQLALLAGLLPCAHLAERFGYRRLFAGGIATFTFASLLCAAASSLPMLIGMRFVQGLGAAAIMSLGIALLRAALGTDRLAAAIAWNALTVAICSAAGPALGALMLMLGSWRWLFLAGLPLSLTALVAASALPEIRPRSSIDAVGILLHGMAATSLFLGIKAFLLHPLAALAMLAGTGLCLALSACRATSVMPFDLLAQRPFRQAVLASICCFIAQSAGIVVLPFHLHSALDQGPLAAGLVLACWPLSVALTSAAANRLAGPASARLQCSAGAGLLAVGLIFAAALPLEAGVGAIAAAMSICGAGFGLFQLANNRNLFLTAPAERSAAAGGMQGTARLVGQTGGTLLASLIFATIWPEALAPRVGFAAAVLFALAAALISLPRKRRHFDIFTRGGTT